MIPKMTSKMMCSRAKSNTGQIFYHQDEIIHFGEFKDKTIGELFDIAERSRPYHLDGRKERDYMVSAINENIITFSSMKLWDRYIAMVSKKHTVEYIHDGQDDPIEQYMGIGDFC